MSERKSGKAEKPSCQDSDCVLSVFASCDTPCTVPSASASASSEDPHSYTSFPRLTIFNAPPHPSFQSYKLVRVAWEKVCPPQTSRLRLSLLFPARGCPPLGPREALHINTYSSDASPKHATSARHPDLRSRHLMRRFHVALAQQSFPSRRSL